jgi:acetyltransferase-like isoleucine patch superfamily enzyme
MLNSIKRAWFDYFTRRLLKKNGVKFAADIVSRGIPYVRVYKGGSITIGNGFKMNNNFAANIIGRQQKCIYISKGNLVIKNNVGVSSAAIICHNSITIGNNVLIGGNTVIYDTDFHSLDFNDRNAIPEIVTNIKTAPVVINDNVFIGGHSLILKGVTIGKNSIVGAGSVVARNIPENEIWAGNPAKKIKDIA